ncbi:MAG: hypothetical protein ACJ796_07500 [Gemmatimonadaceae bacterium]
MRIEILPLILGILVALLGIGIIMDAWTPDTGVAEERRRRPRIERHRNGEALIGLGVLALAAAFIGRDSWRYSVLVVIIGAVFLLVGAVLNARYVRELFVNRGPLRRRDANAQESFIVEREVPAPSKAVEREVESRPEVARGDGWDGPERRKTPRDRERKSPRRGPSAEDSPRG